MSGPGSVPKNNTDAMKKRFEQAMEEANKVKTSKKNRLTGIYDGAVVAGLGGLKRPLSQYSEAEIAALEFPDEDGGFEDAGDPDLYRMSMASGTSAGGWSDAGSNRDSMRSGVSAVSTTSNASLDGDWEDEEDDGKRMSMRSTNSGASYRSDQSGASNRNSMRSTNSGASYRSDQSGASNRDSMRSTASGASYRSDQSGASNRDSMRSTTSMASLASTGSERPASQRSSASKYSNKGSERMSIRSTNSFANYDSDESEGTSNRNSMRSTSSQASYRSDQSGASNRDSMRSTGSQASYRSDQSGA